MSAADALRMVWWLMGANAWLLLVIVVLTVRNAREERRWWEQMEAKARREDKP